MTVSIIVAVAKNWAIGKNNELLWHYPADMQFFRNTTTGHHILTGRKNYFSIPAKFRPLKNRINLVVTRQDTLELGEASKISSIEEGIETAKKAGESELFIIGGGEIYRQCIEKNLVDRMYVTHVNDSFEGDTFFPEISESSWKVVSSFSLEDDEKSNLTATLKTYQRIRK